jgi:hypothetical protein
MLVASPLPPTLSEALSCKVKRQMRLPRRMRLRNLKPTVPNVNGAGRYKPMPSKLIDPIAIALVSQACQSFELLERLHEGSVVLSPDVLISADLTALFHHRPARFFPFFHYPLQLDSQPRI